MNRPLSPRLSSVRAVRGAMLFCAWVVIFLAFASCANLFAQDHSSDEYVVKAGFLFNFARFTEWPEQDAARAIHICVVEDDVLTRQFQSLLRGKTVGPKPIVVLRARLGSDVSDCEVAFFPENSMAKAQSILVSGLKPGVLTVGESGSFLHLGGVINFVIEQDRVRFEINLAAVEEKNVRISSKLLSVGKIVDNRRGSGAR